MRKLLQHFLHLRKRLAYKLVTYYGLLLVIFITIAFNLDKFDARKFSPISYKEQIFFKNESLLAEKTLNLDDIFEQDLSVETTNGYDMILEERRSGILSGVSQSNIKALQSFIYQSQRTDEPLQRRFESTEIYGPFVVNTKSNSYNQYFIKATEAQKEWLNVILDSPFMMGFILMLLGFPVLLWMSVTITKPVQNLTQSANAVATGNLDINPKLEIEGIYEFREVGKSFNHMVRSLKNLTHHQQRMISDISHELKTPLARLQLATAILRRKAGELPEIERIENQIAKLDQMVKDLLAISRQQLNYQTNKAIFSVDEIWNHILEDLTFETSQNNIAFIIKQNIHSPKEYVINGSVDSLASALENLIRNGQKYANQKVLVTMNIAQEHLILSVEDDGEGVSEHEYENIFKPFYRVDEARTRETGGTGLGLAIVQNAVQQHQGTINVTKSEFGGLKMELKIPLWTHQS